MGRVVAGLAIVLVVIGFTSTAGTQDKPVTVVLGITDGQADLDELLADSLWEYLATQLRQTGRYRILPPSALKKTRGDQENRIELARDLDAEILLVARLGKAGERCNLDVTEFDLKKATKNKLASTTVDCGTEGLWAAVDLVVWNLTEGKPHRQVTKRMMDRGIRLSRAGHYMEAVAIFEKILEAEPKNCKVLLRLSSIYARMGNKDLANAYMRKFSLSCPIRTREPRDYRIKREHFLPPGEYFIDDERIHG